LLEFAPIWVERGRGESGRRLAPRPARGNHDQYEEDVEQYPDAQDDEHDHHQNLPKKNKEYELTLALGNSEEKVPKRLAGPSFVKEKLATIRFYLVAVITLVNPCLGLWHTLGYGRDRNLWIPDEYGDQAIRRTGRSVRGPHPFAGWSSRLLGTPSRIEPANPFGALNTG
jgi:hypothetical protein